MLIEISKNDFRLKPIEFSDLDLEKYDIILLLKGLDKFLNEPNTRLEVLKSITQKEHLYVIIPEYVKDSKFYIKKDFKHLGGCEDFPKRSSENKDRDVEVTTIKNREDDIIDEFR